MIRMPRRSVTRFFIPMIDVLTLLFCMFLLLPIIQENATLSDEGPRPGATADELAREVEVRQEQLNDLYKDQQRARAVLAELAAHKRELLQKNVLIQLLHVSPKDGSLFYFDPAESAKPPLKIVNAQIAAALLERHKQEAGQRELYYIFQEPRTDSGAVAPYPTRAQEAAYREWFKNVNYDGCVKPPADKGAQ